LRIRESEKTKPLGPVSFEKPLNFVQIYFHCYRYKISFSGETMEDISQLVQQLNQKIAEKRDIIEPLLNIVRYK
jgi:hypothetical protein